MSEGDIGMAKDAGGSFVTVDPINSEVEQWYVDFGFTRSPQSDSNTLYLPMKAAAARTECLGSDYYVF